MDRLRQKLSSKQLRRKAAGRRTQAEVLEERTYLSVTSLFSGGELQIVSDGPDSIAVGTNPLAPGTVRVTVNGSSDPTLGVIQASSVTSLVIVGSDNDNIIDVSGVTAADFSFFDAGTGQGLQISIDGDDGNDVIIGSADLGGTLLGGNGADTITGSTIGDFINAGDGADSADSGDGDDTIFGGDGNDIIDAGTGDDSVDAGDGQDSVIGGDGADTINAGDGADTVDGGLGNDDINGMSGLDSLLGGDGNDTLRGGADADVISGDLGNDLVEGNAGNDTLSGFAGDDTVNGGVGNDVIDGGGGDDIVNGQSGDDTLNGGREDDRIYGGGGNDSIFGGSGQDTAFGQAGDDTVIGGGDADSLDGGTGNDRVESGGEQEIDFPVFTIGDVVIQEGDGFLDAGLIPTSGAVSFVAVGDFDGDGVDDIAAAIADGTIDFLINDGVGAFTVSDSDTHGTGGGPNPPTAVAADLNGDGLDDVAVTNRNDDTVTVFLNDGTGNGTFLPGTSINVQFPTNTTSSGPVGIRAADMDGDGDIDLVPTIQLGDQGFFFPGLRGAVVFLENNGGGTFQAPVFTNVGPNGTATATRVPDVGDIDGNGTIDVVAPNQAIGEISVLRNDGTGALGMEQRIVVGGNPNLVELGDIDGDGDLDAIVSDDVIGQFYILTNDGTGVFSLTATVLIPGGSGNVVRFADVDGDSDLDVIAASTFNFLFLNDGAGVLTQVAQYPVTGIPVIGDFNGDGRPDVIGGTPTGVQLLRNNFVSPVFATVTVTLDRAAATDVSVDYTVVSSTATPNVDFLPASGTLLFPAGVTSQDIIVEIIPDLVPEPSENFVINLSNISGNASIADGQAHVLIADDDGGIPGSTLSMVDVAVNSEGETSTTVTVVALFSSPATSSGTVSFMTVDGSATAGSDYASTFATVSFGVGDTSVSTTVTIVGDQRGEIDESFFVNLVNPVGVVIEDSQAMVTIIDDDGPVAVPLTVDTVIGGVGADTLIGSNSDDLLIGNAGDDLMSGGGGNDTLLGGAGRDTLDGGDGDDTIDGQGGADSLSGGAGDDTFIWDGQNDGDDTINADAGGDTLTVGGKSTDDTFTVSQSAASELIVSQGTGSITIAGMGLEAGIEAVVINGGSGNDTVTITSVDQVGALVLTVNGGSGGDTISASGASLGNVRLGINGELGDDTLTGSADADTITGGDGNDVISGEAGNDTLRGDADNDSISGGDGNDFIDGNDGNDTASGDAGNDSLMGSFGNDMLIGDVGDDTLDGGFGDDLLNGMSGDDSLLGSFGNDRIAAGSGDDIVRGGNDNDTIQGHSGSDLIDGGHGDDSILGQAGDDTIFGDDGNDTIMGDNGNDLLFGEDGDDVIDGEGASDTIVGGDGHDTLRGGGSDDTILGEDGDDVINGNSGSDTASTGEGADTVSDVETIDENFVLSAEMMQDFDTLASR